MDTAVTRQPNASRLASPVAVLQARSLTATVTANTAK
jgi:hypothetical protein